jgi:hypothetical protein
VTSSIQPLVVPEIYSELGANIASVVTSVARRTSTDHPDTAAAMLRVDLSRSGVRASQDWCLAVLGTLRRGDGVTIDLEMGAKTHV